MVETYSEKVEKFISKDGVECFTGYIVTNYKKFETYKCRQIVIVPSLELEVTFIGETENSSYDELLNTIINLSKTITFNNNSESTSSSKADNADNVETVPEQEKIITKTVNEDMTFDIKENWAPVEEGAPLFTTVKDGVNIAVGLNGVTPLSKGTPQKVFDDFVKFYETDANPDYKTIDYSKSVSTYKAKDGTLCYYGSIIGRHKDMPYLCDVVIVPSKNKL
ncbi:MAG: hypothetical protein IJC83_05585, partial [Oscillospiraceae bacterium]|nr:hypothetical protein [Oscillospiraceae bacterium]